MLFPRWGWMVLSGIVSVVLAISILVSWPFVIGLATAIHSLPSSN